MRVPMGKHSDLAGWMYLTVFIPSATESQLLTDTMPSQSKLSYSIGSLTGPVPFAQVVRSMIANLNDKNARIGPFKETVSLDDRSSPEVISEFIRNLTRVAERWTQQRIHYLDAAQGLISHRDTRLFDHDLIGDMSRSKTYTDLTCVLDRCETEHRLLYCAGIGGTFNGRLAKAGSVCHTLAETGSFSYGSKQGG